MGSVLEGVRTIKISSFHLSFLTKSIVIENASIGNLEGAAGFVRRVVGWLSLVGISTGVVGDIGFVVYIVDNVSDDIGKKNSRRTNLC